MTLWSNTATGNTASANYKPPKFSAPGVGRLANGPAFCYGSVYGVNAAAAKLGGSAPDGISQGWVSERLGTGHVTSVTVTAGGTGFAAGNTYTLAYTGVNSKGQTYTYGSNDTVTANSTGALQANLTNVTLSSNLYYNVTSVIVSSNIASISVTTPGTGYVAGQALYLKFGNSTGVNSNVSVTANSTGGVTAGAATVTNGGSGFNGSETVTGLAYANGTLATPTTAAVFGAPTLVAVGTGATFTTTVGGKAGRRFLETLVAANMTTDAANTPASIV